MIARLRNSTFKGINRFCMFLGMPVTNSISCAISWSNIAGGLFIKKYSGQERLENNVLPKMKVSPWQMCPKYAFPMSNQPLIMHFYQELQWQP
jgi:hypothetical protein